MSGIESVQEITAILASLEKELDALEAAGAEIPAVVKNTVRMRGALRQLQVQFTDLSDSLKG